MKKSTTAIGVAALLATFATLTGCGLLQKAYTPVYTEIPAVVKTNTITTTNVVVAYVTNTVTHEVVNQTNVVISPVTVFTVTPATTVTNWVKNEAIAAGINTAGQVGSASGVPFAGTAAGILGLLYGIGAGILNARNKNKALVIASTLVDNIESARSLLKSVTGGSELDAKYVAGIADSQTMAGIREDIHKIVKSAT